MHVSFFVRAPFGAGSGSYAYDHGLVAGLRGLGHTVAIIEAHPGISLADPPDGTPRLIDGPALPTLLERDDKALGQPLFGLIHHSTMPAPDADEAARHALRAAAERHFGRFVRLVATGEPTVEWLVNECRVSRDRVALVVPGTDDAPRCPGSDGPGCRILSIGALIPRKGHDLLMRALVRLFDLDWHLTIVGSAERDPVHARALAALADTLGITHRVRFAGRVTDAALDALWQESDLFALATRFETYGMPVAAALKRGLPVAVTAGGAAGALVAPEAGVVCPLDDESQLSKALRRLIFGRTLRRDMGEVAWQIGQTLPTWRMQAELLVRALA